MKTTMLFLCVLSLMAVGVQARAFGQMPARADRTLVTEAADDMASAPDPMPGVIVPPPPVLQILSCEPTYFVRTDIDSEITTNQPYPFHNVRGARCTRTASQCTFYAELRTIQECPPGTEPHLEQSNLAAGYCYEATEHLDMTFDYPRQADPYFYFTWDAELHMGANFTPNIVCRRLLWDHDQGEGPFDLVPEVPWPEDEYNRVCTEDAVARGAGDLEPFQLYVPCVPIDQPGY